MNLTESKLKNIINEQLESYETSLTEGLLYEGDDSVLSLFENATLEEGGNVCGS